MDKNFFLQSRVVTTSLLPSATARGWFSHPACSAILASCKDIPLQLSSALPMFKATGLVTNLAYTPVKDCKGGLATLNHPVLFPSLYLQPPNRQHPHGPHIHSLHLIRKSSFLPSQDLRTRERIFFNTGRVENTRTLQREAPCFSLCGERKLPFSFATMSPREGDEQT